MLAGGSAKGGRLPPGTRIAFLGADGRRVVGTVGEGVLLETEIDGKRLRTPVPAMMDDEWPQGVEVLG